jgi:hypothetical protein
MPESAAGDLSIKTSIKRDNRKSFFTIERFRFKLHPPLTSIVHISYLLSSISLAILNNVSTERKSSTSTSGRDHSFVACCHHGVRHVGAAPRRRRPSVARCTGVGWRCRLNRRQCQHPVVVLVESRVASVTGTRRIDRRRRLHLKPRLVGR